MTKMKKGTRNSIFAAIGLIIAIVIAFLIAAYVSDDSSVSNPNYGNTVVQQPATT